VSGPNASCRRMLPAAWRASLRITDFDFASAPSAPSQTARRQSGASLGQLHRSNWSSSSFKSPPKSFAKPRMHRLRPQQPRAAKRMDTSTIPGRLSGGTHPARSKAAIAHRESASPPLPIVNVHRQKLRSGPAFPWRFKFAMGRNVNTAARIPPGGQQYQNNRPLFP